MKPYENKWQVVRKGNGKYYPRVQNEHTAPYWPWTPGEFDTLEEAKKAVLSKKFELEEQARLNAETVVWEG